LAQAPPPSQNLARTGDLAQAHARFARAALTIYAAAAFVAVGLLVISLLTDRTHDEGQIRERLLLETDLGAHSLAGHLGRLAGELRRLGTRSEVNLFDQNLAPEQSLLDLSHERSTYFNLGVAILEPSGQVVYSVPGSFLGRGATFATEPWFVALKQNPATLIEPVQPDKPDAVVYVVSPIIRGGQFSGALLGGIDVAQDGPIAEKRASSDIQTVLATRAGVVVFPPKPPAFSHEASWTEIFSRSTISPFTDDVSLAGVRSLVAASPVESTNLVLLSVGTRDALYRPARTRLYTRLAAALFLAVLPLVLLVGLLQRSLAVFRRTEEAAVREERLQHLGEAANSIAHEVKNALNGLSVGLELVVRPGDAERRDRLLVELRGEISRLSEFTTELMTFSRGIEPRRAELDLAEFVPKVTGLMKDSATEHGTSLDVVTTAEPIVVKADPNLLHVVISNLVGNALDAVGGVVGEEPRVEVRLAKRDHTAELRVVDNGKGVASKVKKNLFEPFQTGKPNGVGIGLALSRKIARAHGGDLTLEAIPRGASFLLTLPLEG
jgi:two-component system C4-dicarboxylate transport sensor histidine kinase DctB